MQFEPKKIDLSPNSQIHLIGIGGAGMSGIARGLIKKGFLVSGSDLKPSPNTQSLERLGVQVMYGHSEGNVAMADVVVVSSAIPQSNPELLKAIQMRSPIYQRAEMLNWLMTGFKTRCVVAGTHGKTTTTIMITKIFEAAGLNPSYVVGANRLDSGINSEIHSGEACIVEGDESDGSILCYDASHLVITNLEEEHMNYYKTRENLMLHFKKVMQRVIDHKGLLFINEEDENTMSLREAAWGPSLRFFSLKKGKGLYPKNCQFSSEGTRFELYENDNLVAEIVLSTQGYHNISNALAAIQFAREYDIPLGAIKKGLASFSGAKRRLENIFANDTVSIYDDYAHHPTEIITTLNGARNLVEGRLICIFQPHRYSRTQELFSEFVHSFSESDWLILMDIFPANEAPIEGIHSQKLKEVISSQYPQLRVGYFSEVESLIKHLCPDLIRGDVVVTMGAGNVGDIAKKIAKQLIKETES
tara:strand:- start:2377 stop:3795 length:1419 start_codon:yes stop_codon:yes gene_type:complete